MSIISITDKYEEYIIFYRRFVNGSRKLKLSGRINFKILISKNLYNYPGGITFS